jgi:hypothetical protein
MAGDSNTPLRYGQPAFLAFLSRPLQGSAEPSADGGVELAGGVRLRDDDERRCDELQEE